MNIEKVIKDSFVVIGKEGSTDMGEGFIRKLWDEANGSFAEVAELVKKDEEGNLAGVWGAMSDFSRSFRPWDDFSRGLYLAGVEVKDDAKAPEGWCRWVVPGYEYLKVEQENPDTFREMLEYMKKNDIELVGAVHDFSCPKTGKNYMFFPIRKL